MSSARIARASVLFGCVALSPAVARAEDGIARWEDGSSRIERAPEKVPERSSSARDLSPAHRVPAVLAAVGPGAAIHGLGHAASGDHETAGHLLAAEGVGLGFVVVGLGGLAATGASRYTVVPFALTAMVGTSIFLGSYLADIYGTAAPPIRGSPSTRAPRMETEAGYRYVYDPQFRYRNFFVESVDIRIDRLRVAPSAWLSVDDQNVRLRGAVGWRFWGPLADGNPWTDGSFTEAELAVTRHDYRSDGFSLTTVELFALARRDLGKFERSLDGSFAELGAGFALQRIEYRVPGQDVPGDTEQMLLARAAFGFYLADPDREGGEVMVYYDHRHDDYAAGLHMTGLGSGVLGHFGITSRYFFSSGFGFVTEAQMGSAYVAGASLAYRTGGRR